MIGLVATGVGFLGAVVAAILLIGTATFGWAAVSFRLTHPGLVIGFAEDSPQLAGELLAVAAGLAVTVQFIRAKAAGHFEGTR